MWMLGAVDVISSRVGMPLDCQARNMQKCCNAV